MTISIITPSFNHAQFIEHTINSIIEQHFPELEYIIIDGGSNDGTEDIIQKYRENIAYYVSEKDKGQSHAINKGFCKATGEIIAWLNSDDLYLPNTLKIVSEFFTNNPETDILYGDVENLFDDGHTEYYSVTEFDPLDFLSRVSIHQPSVFWRRKILDEVGLLDENLHYMMDYDLWMRFFFNYKSKKTNQVLSVFRIHEKAKTYNNPPEMYNEYRMVLSWFFNSFGKKNHVIELKKLNLYCNSLNTYYKFRTDVFDELLLNKTFLTYLKICIQQEYTVRNTRETNRLLIKNSLRLNFLFTFSMFLKANLRLYIFKR